MKALRCEASYWRSSSVARSSVLIMILLACDDAGTAERAREPSVDEDGGAADGSFEEGTFGDAETDSGARDTCDRSVRYTCEDTMNRGLDCYRFAAEAREEDRALSGGTIDGSVEITVLERATLSVVGDALVMLGDDLGTVHRGRTNRNGKITFTGDGLVGPITVHVAAPCLVTTTLVAVDARYVTVQADILPTAACVAGAPAGPRGESGAFVSGELLLPHGWDSLPVPREGEERVAYVFTTRVRAGLPNPLPDAGGTSERPIAARSADDGTPDAGNEHAYRIFTRTGALAVYALAGIEHAETGEFVPHLMGVTRGVTAVSGEETTAVDLAMDLALDRRLDVALDGLPDALSSEPLQLRVSANLDLGGDGMIVRVVSSRELDVLMREERDGLFGFVGQPTLGGSLCGTLYDLAAGLYGGDTERDPPYTQVRRAGVSQSVDPIVVGGFLDIPRAEQAEVDLPLAGSRSLRWRRSSLPPDLYIVQILGSDGLPTWTQYVPGTHSEAFFPDLMLADSMGGIGSGEITWSVRAVTIDGFVYDELSYMALTPDYWSKTAIDVFVQAP